MVKNQDFNGQNKDSTKVLKIWEAYSLLALNGLRPVHAYFTLEKFRNYITIKLEL